MIIHLALETNTELVESIAKELKAIVLKKEDYVLVTSSKVNKVPEKYKDVVCSFQVFKNDMQLSNKEYRSEQREINIGDIKIGGNSNNCVFITGPCSVETEAQIEKCAQFCVEQGIKLLRAGCFKPRTSPYSFQGLGLEGLKLLDKMRLKYNLKIITEVKDASHVNEIVEYADIVQIGAKAMYDHGILKTCSKAKKPILIKRGFGSTLQEFIQAAEFVLSGGNDQVILCERGIRTFETNTRFTLDLCGVSFLKEHTNLPVIVDPSHAMGFSYGVPDLARASVAMGIEGVLIESHPNPPQAWSDASQQLNFSQAKELIASTKTVANAVGRVMI